MCVCFCEFVHPFFSFLSFDIPLHQFLLNFSFLLKNSYFFFFGQWTHRKLKRKLFHIPVDATLSFLSSFYSLVYMLHYTINTIEEREKQSSARQEKTSYISFADTQTRIPFLCA